MYANCLSSSKKIFAVAPMMDWTDKHCRYFHRLMSSHSLLYTEMIVADAIIHGDKEHLLGFNETEHPVALQLGGSDPQKLALAAKAGEAYGYDEINLNVGCPSDRVQSGTFGACLMREPELVANCVAAMKEVVDIPVTVKCRIGVDDQEPKSALYKLAEKVWGEGCDALWVHARKAWLEGLSPKENRDIPPLDYDLVYDLKRENPKKYIGINGGIETLNQSLEMLNEVDGVMLGRAPYKSPDMMRYVDRVLFGQVTEPVSTQEICDAMCAYAEMHLSQGGKLNHITRHMLGLFQSVAGARRYRQILTVGSVKEKAGPEVIRSAFEAVGNNDRQVA